MGNLTTLAHPVAWAPRAKPKRIRATYTRPHGVRHLLSAYDVGADGLYGHIKKRKSRVEFLALCRYLRSLYPPEIRLWNAPGLASAALLGNQACCSRCRQYADDIPRVREG